MFKSLKEKVLNSITAHPKLVTFGIGITITVVFGTAVGLITPHQAFAGGVRWSG